LQTHLLVSPCKKRFPLPQMYLETLNNFVHYLIAAWMEYLQA
jgi:hypothetical protein